MVINFRAFKIYKFYQQLVVADTAGKYFAKVGGVLKEPEIACPADHVQAANAVLDQIEGYVALVGRKVKPAIEWMPWISC